MSVSDNTRADLPTLDAASRHVFDVAAALQAELTSLVSRLDPLAAQWQGPSAAAFQAARAQWQEHAAKLTTALNDIGHGLVANTQNLRASEDASRHGFTSISSVLG